MGNSGDVSGVTAGTMANNSVLVDIPEMVVVADTWDNSSFSENEGILFDN